MSAYVLLDVLKLEQAERIRKAEQERLIVAAQKAERRPSIVESALRALRRG